MSKTWCFQVITTNWQILSFIALSKPTCKNANSSSNGKSYFWNRLSNYWQLTHRLQAFLFIYSSWLLVLLSGLPALTLGRTLTRDLLLSHWFEEAGRPSSYLVTGCDPPQNGKARSLMSAAERRWWCVGNVRCWRPIPSLLHELREVVQEVRVTSAACTNAVASASEKKITFNITLIM